MKAIVARGIGGPEQLDYTDWPDPILEAGEVLVKVAATACNHADKWLMNGMLGDLPMVPGIDVSGTIVDIAPDVTTIGVGTRVLLNPATACDACEYCYIGEHGMCPQRRGLGQYIDGGFAEYVKIPWRNAQPIRDNLSFEEAAAIPSAFFTAWQLLTRRASVCPGMTVLVMAAGSGVGSAAIQIAHLHGARVIATAGSDDKLERARQWGADEVVNYSDAGWAKQVLALTGGEGAHVVVDTVGPEYWPGYAECTRRGGKIIAFSMTSGQFGKVDINALVRRQLSFIGSSPQGSKAIVREVMEMVNARRLRGVVDRVLPLRQAAEAEVAMADRKVIGKIILKPE